MRFSLPPCVLHVLSVSSARPDNNKLHGAEPFSTRRQLCSYSRNSQYFVELEGLLSRSQEPSPVPNPKPQQSRPHHLILSLQDPSWHYPPTYVSVFLVICFLLAFPPITDIISSHSCHMPCPSHPPWLHHSKYTWRRVQVMKLFVMQLSPTSCHFVSPWS
jgi:hypothetical protein